MYYNMRKTHRRPSTSHLKYLPQLKCNIMIIIIFYMIRMYVVRTTLTQKWYRKFIFILINLTTRNVSLFLLHSRTGKKTIYAEIICVFSLSLSISHSLSPSAVHMYNILFFSHIDEFNSE